MARQNSCVFCDPKFPHDYQIIDDSKKYWFFVHNINPHWDYHCLIVLKPQVFDNVNHCPSLSDVKFDDQVMLELGPLLNKACRTIKACSPEIESVFITALGAGDGSKHLHFHLIPKRRDEQVKTLHNPKTDGGGMFFLARKEIMVDGLHDYLKTTTGGKADILFSEIDEAVKKRVKDNTKLLKKKYLQMNNSNN
jgi:diadenosine tetraphosphate (Ap4A) HIT family hydrolase